MNRNETLREIANLEWQLKALEMEEYRRLELEKQIEEMISSVTKES